MIHRVVFGSIERFIGVITEHFAGAFPTWLSPVQVKILTITERADEYAKKVAAALGAQGFRVELDLRNEKIGKKIREAQLEKAPYMLVLGDKEAESHQVAVRHRVDGDLGVMNKDIAGLNLTPPFAGKLMDSQKLNVGEEIAKDTKVATLVDDRTMLETFGRDRVFNSPISEACICGTAVGMNVEGIIPHKCEFAVFEFNPGRTVFVIDAISACGKQPRNVGSGGKGFSRKNTNVLIAVKSAVCPGDKRQGW